jgi:zinc protease
MKELKGIVGEIPITDEEIKVAKDSLIQRLPQRFGSVSQINDTITGLVLWNLPDDYYQTFAKNIAAVTKDDLLRVAKRYIDLNHLAIVIVGDRALVEGPLKATGVAPITILDIEGNPATGAGAPSSSNNN